MTTTLERAARAVMMLRDDQSATASDIARAVLMAVREPDDAFPGAYAIGVSGSASDDERGRLVFKCMIDAILEGK